jgi:hypothetical protein
MNTIKEAALRAYGADKAVKDAENAARQAEEDQKAIAHLSRVLQAWGITVHVDSPEIIIDGVKISGKEGNYYRAQDTLAAQHLCSECGGERMGWGWQYISTLAELGRMWAEPGIKLCSACQQSHDLAVRDADQAKAETDANADFARALARLMRVHGMLDYDDREDYYDDPPY